MICDFLQSDFSTILADVASIFPYVASIFPNITAIFPHVASIFPDVATILTHVATIFAYVATILSHITAVLTDIATIFTDVSAIQVREFCISRVNGKGLKLICVCFIISVLSFLSAIRHNHSPATTTEYTPNSPQYSPSAPSPTYSPTAATPPSPGPTYSPSAPSPPSAQQRYPDECVLYKYYICVFTNCCVYCCIRVFMNSPMDVQYSPQHP